MISIKAVQRSLPARFRISHGAGPEAAGAVAFAIVHPIAWRGSLGVGNDLEDAATGVEDRKPAAHGQRVAPCHAKRESANVLAGVEDFVMAGIRIETMNQALRDIDPRQ